MKTEQDLKEEQELKNFSENIISMAKAHDWQIVMGVKGNSGTYVMAEMQDLVLLRIVKSLIKNIKMRFWGKLYLIFD